MGTDNKDTPLLDEEREREILNAAPVGTWVLLLIFAVVALASWAWLFFAVFLSHGPVS